MGECNRDREASPSRAIFLVESRETLSFRRPVPRSTHAPAAMTNSLHLTECRVSSSSSPVGSRNTSGKSVGAGTKEPRGKEGARSCSVKTRLPTSCSTGSPILRSSFSDGADRGMLAKGEAVWAE